LPHRNLPSQTLANQQKADLLFVCGAASNGSTSGDMSIAKAIAHGPRYLG
jgi:hypothetical protein